MPDAVIPGNATPDTWQEAFAALPQETPPAQGWERVSARLEVRRRNRLPAWIGLAAAAALVLAVTPWDRPEPQPPVEPSHARLATHPAPAGAAEATITTPAPTKIPVEPSHARLAPSHARLPATRPKTTQRSTAPLYDLYAESAQLEALLTLARDDRVSSAGAALLADELDAQVAAIDASLSQPDLDDGERLRLWRARVDALRQAAGFESTQRLLASQGRSDVMLVSVD